MSEPIRLRDGAPPLLRAAIVAAQRETLDSARAAALEARVLASLGAAAGSGGAIGATKAAAAKGLFGLSYGKVALVSAIAVSVAAGSAVAIVKREVAPTPTSSSAVLPAIEAVAPPPPVEAVSPPALESSSSAAPSSSASPAVTAPRPKPSASSASQDLPAEASLLRRAQDALRSSPADALSIADEHARTYPRGALAQEREVIAIEALTKLGRRREAEQRAARFERAYPESTHKARLDTLLGR